MTYRIANKDCFSLTSLSCIRLVLYITLLISCDETTTSSINGGEVNGGEVNGGEVNGGEVNGGELNGGIQSPSNTEFTWQVTEEVQLTIVNHPFSMTFNHPYGDAIQLDGSSLGFGVVDELQENKSYDPYWLHHPYLGSLPSQSDTLRWVSISYIESFPDEILNDQDPISLDVVLSDGKTATLLLERSSQSSIAFTINYPTSEAAVAAFGYWEAPARGEEQFYGLGESFDQVARRGSYRSLGFQIIPNSESGYNEAHVPVPLLISTQGIAYFFDTDHPSYFDVAYERDTIIRAEQARPSPLKLHLIWSAHPSGAINTYYDLTGRPLVPPYWAFAPHYWRNVTSGQAEVQNDMTQMRELGIPGGNFWIDRPYQRAYMDCTFDPVRYPNPAQMQSHFEDLGYKMILWHAPYTSEASDAWEEAESGNYFVDGPLFFMNFGKIMDFTNPNAMDLWARLLDRFNQFNVAGYKLDYGEDIQIGLGGNRLRYQFFDGSDEITMHHRYATFYHRAYLQTLPPASPRPSDDLIAPNDQAHLVDGFLLGRSSTHGGQQYVHALWPGDLDSDFRTYLEDDYWVGGLPAAVIGGLTLSVSGFPFYGSDTGGFRNNRPTQDVLIRWAWQTAFSAIMQVGGGGSSHFPWAEAGDSEAVYDETGIELMREAARWNLRLTDYRFTYGLLARTTGIPLLQPLGFAYPQDGRHPDDTYLLGPDLLIAPVIGPNPERQIPIPRGEWLDFWNSELMIGPSTTTQNVPLGSQAIFVRSGAIIPLLHPDIHTLNRINKDREELNTVNTIDSVSHPLTWLLVPPTTNRTYEYQNHDSSSVTLSADHAVISPGLRTVYPAYELSIRHDPNLTLSEVLYNDQALIWVEADERMSCLSCVWYEVSGVIHVRLPSHQGSIQTVAWR